MKSVCFIAISLLIAGCGGVSSRTSKGPSQDPEGIGIVDGAEVRVFNPEALSPKSTEAATQTKARGDAAFQTAQWIYRGTTAGLVIGTLENHEFREESTVYLPGMVSDILVHNHMAYVACGPAGVYLVDVKNAKSPKLRKGIDTPGGATRLTRSDDTLVIADGTQGVVLVDISKPENPKTIGTWKSKGYVRHAILHGDFVYAAEGRQGIAVIAAKKSGALHLMTRIPTNGEARALDFSANRVFVANGSGGLVAFLGASDGRLREAGHLTLRDMARDVVVRGERAYVASGDRGLTIINTSNIQNPRKTLEMPSDIPINRVRLGVNNLLVGNDAAGLLILDISRPDDPRRVFPKTSAGTPP